MKIQIPVVEEVPRMIVTHEVNEAWVKRAILSYMRGESGFKYKHGFDIDIKLIPGAGSIVTVTETNGKTGRVPFNIQWPWKKEAKVGA
jgi:hypothetical protein